MTSLYLTTSDASAATPGGAETTRWKLAGTPGAAGRPCNKNTVAGPTAPLPVTDSATAGSDGNTLAWYSDPLPAVTIAGQITASLWGAESSSSANAAPCIGVYRCDPSGQVISTIADPAGPSQGGLELSTTAGAKTCVIIAGNVTDTALAAGDRLKVTLNIDDASGQGGTGSMTAVSRNAQLYVNGATGLAGQAVIAFTETFVSAGPGHVFPTVAGRPVNLGREVPSILTGS